MSLCNAVRGDVLSNLLKTHSTEPRAQFCFVFPPLSSHPLPWTSLSLASLECLRLCKRAARILIHFWWDAVFKCLSRWVIFNHADILLDRTINGTPNLLTPLRKSTRSASTFDMPPSTRLVQLVQYTNVAASTVRDIANTANEPFLQVVAALTITILNTVQVCLLRLPARSLSLIL